MRFGVTILAFGAVLAACTPAAEEKPAEPAVAAGPDAITPHNPFFGTWGITSAKIAPWWDGKGEEPAPDQAMSTISFAADKTTGAALLTCDKPKYAVNIIPERSLFEGNLPDPAKDAAALGFTSSTVTSLNYTCVIGTGDVSLDFPMINDDTIMLGLDNVLYTFQRTSK